MNLPKTKKAAKTLSMRSLQSNKTLRSIASINNIELALDFEELVTNCCAKFQCPRNVVVKKDYQLGGFLAALKRSPVSPKSKRMSTAGKVPNNSEGNNTVKGESPTAFISLADDQYTTVITAIYNSINKFYEILFLKQTVIPRILMKIIGIIAPYYRQLEKISIKKCRIDADLIYEMSKFLPLTSITEICLDDSPLSGTNYCLLLEKPCRITSLSLSRCNISDQVCVQIASKLHCQESAEETLAALDLSCNQITNVGAKGIGEALRSNRHLRYLNLADNRIDDDGADQIFHALVEFALTCDEITDKRQRYFEYLKMKQAIYMKFITEWTRKSVDDFSSYNKKLTAKKDLKSSKKSKPQSTSGDIEMSRKADILANQLVGQFVDPFNSYNTKFINGYSRCIGNFVLCYLNLSYNYLTYISVKKLGSVVKYQSTNKRIGQFGLLKVLIDGNQVPSNCDELDYIGHQLQKNVIQYSPRYGGSTRDRIKSGRISIAQ